MSTGGRRAMRAVIGITVLATLVFAGAAVAKVRHYTMTEAQAERFVAGHVGYVDREKLTEYNAQINDFKQEIAKVCASGSPDYDYANCKLLQQELGTVQGAGCGCKYKPVDPECRGASPSKDAYHF